MSCATVKQAATHTGWQTAKAYVERAQHVLVVVNGRPVDRASISRIDPRSISGLQILKPDEARKRYGNRAREGAVIVSTRN